jgi:gamma-tubulin complex component 2
MHSRYEFGCISQSFAHSLRQLLREYDILTAQLEALYNIKELVSLQKLFYLVQPAASTLRILYRLIVRISDKTGGELLDELQLCLQEQGDEKLRSMFSEILQQTSEPFLRMLSNWIFRGEINDRNGEFMIQENTSFQREALAEDITARFWEGRYTLRRAHVPRMFRLHADKILAAGKYLNILRDCSPNATEVNSMLPAKTSLTLDANGGPALLRIIDEAHLCSSQLLLRILLEKHNLMSHLTSLRRFMLLEHGDFFVQFMDMAEKELRQEAQLLTVGSVQLLLQGAVNTSSLASDPHRDDFECTLASLNLIQHLHKIQTAGTTDSHTSNPLQNAGDSNPVPSVVQGLKGVEALTFEYRVGWPVSIVLSRRIVTKYQLLSRLLFFCKHVELRVLSCWRDHQQSKELRGLRKELGPSHCLRHRMLHFLQNFVYYMTVEVIAPRSHEMMENLDTAVNIDDVLVLHERFLDTCLKECLLNSQELLRVLTKLTTTCLLFADQMTRFSSSVDTFDKKSLSTSFAIVETGVAKSSDERRRRIDLQEEFMRHEVCHDAYVRMINKFSDSFDTQLGDFLEMLWNDSNRYFFYSYLYLKYLCYLRHHAQLSNLCVRLDYNGFYTERFASENYS